jgi:hypothetical protein
MPRWGSSAETSFFGVFVACSSSTMRAAEWCSGVSNFGVKSGVGEHNPMIAA